MEDEETQKNKETYFKSAVDELPRNWYSDRSWQDEYEVDMGEIDKTNPLFQSIYNTDADFNSVIDEIKSNNKDHLTTLSLLPEPKSFDWDLVTKSNSIITYVNEVCDTTVHNVVEEPLLDDYFNITSNDILSNILFSRGDNGYIITGTSNTWKLLEKLSIRMHSKVFDMPMKVGMSETEIAFVGNLMRYYIVHHYQLNNDVMLYLNELYKKYR